MCNHCLPSSWAGVFHWWYCVYLGTQLLPGPLSSSHSGPGLLSDPSQGGLPWLPRFKHLRILPPFIACLYKVVHTLFKNSFNKLSTVDIFIALPVCWDPDGYNRRHTQLIRIQERSKVNDLKMLHHANSKQKETGMALLK